MDIFYFTGTGNSLFVAKELNKKLGGKLISMAGGVSQSQAPSLGFVFPMYNHTVPSLVLDFIKGFDDLRGYYIFAVCTFGHSPGITMIDMKKAIEKKGGQLSLGYAIKQPYNYIQPAKVKYKGLFDSFVLVENTETYCIELNQKAKVKINEMSGAILKRKTGKLQTSDKIIETLSNKLGLRDTIQKKSWAKVAGTWTDEEETFQDMVKHMDDGFWTNENCDNCGICEEVCPASNIDILGGPNWHGKCEQCFACLHWCPEDAIEFRKSTEKKLRYHNIEVDLNEMIGDQED